MSILKYIIFGLVFLIALIINSALPYITPPFVDSFFGHPFFQRILEFLTAKPIWTAVITKIILGVQVMLTIFLYPYKYINDKKRKIIKRIYANLFNERIRDHRVTLFREVGYPRAIWRHICSLCFHLSRPWYLSRFLLHFKHPPLPGHYLIVDTRFGRFRRSRTMFKVEESLEENCEGIVGLIRFEKGIGTLIPDLPDITKVNLSNPTDLESKMISEYMQKGCIRDMDMLKRLHVRARHFLGSVIYKTNGEPWGMLLVDSIAAVNPFNQIIIDKFRVYSETLTDLFS